MGQHSTLNFQHLKDFSSSEGYWSTTDCVEVAKDILDITKATSVLEIGFNIGYSASVWATLGIEKLVIIDINNHKDTLPAIHSMVKTFPEVSISWWLGDSLSEEAFLLELDTVDLSFIDGEHSYSAALSDSYLSIVNGAKWLLYDDVIEHHANGIYEVIKRLESVGLISVVKKYPMTWTEQGELILTKVNYVNI
jgi:hypothetical protein